MTASIIANEFNITKQHVWVLKSRMKSTLTDIYNHLVERRETIIKCQEACNLLNIRDIQDVWIDKKDKNASARSFVKSLFMQSETYPQENKYRSAKKVLDFIEEKGIKYEDA